MFFRVRPAPTGIEYDCIQEGKKMDAYKNKKLTEADCEPLGLACNAVDFLGGQFDAT